MNDEIWSKEYYFLRYNSGHFNCYLTKTSVCSSFCINFHSNSNSQFKHRLSEVNSFCPAVSAK